MLRSAPAFALPLLLATAAHAQGEPAAEPAADATPAPEAAPKAPLAAPEEPSPAPTEPAEAAEPPAPAEPAAEAASLCPQDVPCLAAGDLAAWPKLRLRAGYAFVQADDKVLFVGHNDGFFLEHARLGLEASYRGTFRVRLVLDATSVLSGHANDPVRPVLAAARDAYVEWRPSDYFFVRAGQSFVPFLVEGDMSTAELNFTARSVAADGVRVGQGYYEPGLSPDRQLGVMLGASEAPLGPVHLDYRLAITNGNGKNHLGNDNKLPAVFGRLGAGFEDYVKAGFSLQYNPRSVGQLPNLYDETDVALAGDVRLKVFGVDVLGQAVWKMTSFDTVFPEGDPARTDNGLGVTTWIVLDEPFGLPTFGVKPGYRFSYYDPRSSSPEDQLFEHTFGLRYDPPTPIPMAFIVDVTLLFESAQLNDQLADSQRYLDNHRAVALVQFDL